MLFRRKTLGRSFTEFLQAHETAGFQHIFVCLKNEELRLSKFSVQYLSECEWIYNEYNFIFCQKKWLILKLYLFDNKCTKHDTENFPNTRTKYGICRSPYKLYSYTFFTTNIQHLIQQIVQSDELNTAFASPHIDAIRISSYMKTTLRMTFKFHHRNQ